MSNKIVIGLTGGIASGKSTAARYLYCKGMTVLDTDTIAKQLLDNFDVKQQLIQAFGEGILCGSSVHVALLRQKSFASIDSVRTINSIIWPFAVQSIQERLLKLQGTIVVESALLFESELDAYTDCTATISCSTDTRVRRLYARGMDRNTIDVMLSSQLTDSQREVRADCTIDNNRTLQHFYQDIDRCTEQLLG